MGVKKRLLSNKKIINFCKEITFDDSIISITNESGIILYANENFCKISGYSEEELVGSNHRIVKSGKHPLEFYKGMWASIRKEKLWRGEICNRSKDGNLYWVKTTIYPIHDDEVGEKLYFSVRQDITHSKKFEEILGKLSSVAKIGYWDWDIKSGEINWTDEIYEIHGLTKGEHTPSLETGINFYAPEHREIITKCIETSLETGQAWDVELQILSGPQKIRKWVRSVGQCERHNGEPYRVHGTFQDIDKNKLMRIEHQKTQNQLNLALESAGIGNWIYYPNEDRLIWDEASFTIFGVKKENFRGHFKDWESCLIPGEKEKSSKEFVSVIENKETVYNSKFKINHPQKGIRSIKGRAFVEYNELGEPVEIVGLNWDITSEEEFQNVLIDARQKAVEATQAKSAFLASMSHEIRTPMNGIMGMLELLGDTSLNGQQRELINTIESCGEQLLGVVNDVLDFSKIEAGKLDLEYISFEPRKIMKGVFAIFKAQAEKKGVELILDIDERVPTYLNGDETRIKQVLTNLVSNALKFTEFGFITMTLKMDKKRSSSKQGVFLFTVRDTGIGIPLESQGNLFESFRQVDETTTRRFGGSGLGLAICRSLVERMGGHIGVESSEGDGAIFFFDIMAGISEKRIEEKIEQDIKTFRKDLKILIAEDNVVNQKLAISFLNKMGLFTYSIADDGQEAVRACLETKNPFDLIFMDVQMPVMDGLAATQKIKKVVNNPPVIIAMTANAFEEDKKRCFDAGMDDFISKPIKKHNIEHSLKKHFPAIEESKVVKKDNPMESSSDHFTLIDKDKILFEFHDDLDIFEELIEDYISQLPVFIKTLEKAVEEKDSEQLKITGHTLKGIVSNFYSEQLREAAYHLEMAGKNDDFEEVEMKIDMFKTFNEKVLKEMKSFLIEFGGDQAA